MSSQFENPYEPPIYFAGSRWQSTLAFGLSAKIIAYSAGIFALSFNVLLFVNALAGLTLMGLGALALAPLAIATNGRTLYETGHLTMQWHRRKHIEYRAGWIRR